MEIAWRDPEGEKITGRIEAQVQPFVEAIGLHLTAMFLLEFGGAETDIGSNPQPRGNVARLIGLEAARKLGEAPLRCRRVPLGSCFLSRYLRSLDFSIADIARKLHRSDVTVRSYLLSDEERADLTIKRKSNFDALAGEDADA